MPKETVDRTWLAVQPYCILCRLDLPRSRSEDSIGPSRGDTKHEDWELDVIGFFDAAREDADSGLPAATMGIHVFRADLRDSRWPADYGSPYWTPREKDNVKHTPRLKGYVKHTPPQKGDAKRTPFRIGFRRRSYLDSPSAASLQRALFFVHACCWKTVRRSGHHHHHQHDPDAALSFGCLYRLGQQTRSIVPRTCVAGEYAAALPRLPPVVPAAAAAADGASTDLDALLSQAASKLPVELQAQIAGHFHGGLLSSLLRARETASSLLSLLPTADGSPMNGIREEELLCTRCDAGCDATESRREPRGRLVASRIRVFGHTYFRQAVFIPRTVSRKRKRSTNNGGDCDSDNDDDGKDRLRGRKWDVGIPVRGGVAIAGATVWIGPLGIRALVLLYEDGSKSPCLGDPGWPGLECFVQTLCCDSTTSVLLACRDDLKLLRIQSNGRENSGPGVSAQTWPMRTLWNAETELPACGDLVVADAIHYPGQLLHYPGWRLCHFLPLQLNGVPATGLTAYCTPRGVSGMAAHFGSDSTSVAQRERQQKQRHIGWHRGLPLHLPLAAGEFIVFLHLRVEESKGQKRDYGPSLIIGTNLGRTILFGVQFMSFSTRFSSSVPLTEGQYPVKGLFTDLLTADGYYLKSIGACIDRPAQRHGRPLPLPQASTDAPLLAAPGPINGQIDITTAFLSTASLGGDVRRLQLRRLAARCVGLRIDHRDGRTEILGSWEPSDEGGAEEATISDIYTASDTGVAASGLPQIPFPALSAVTFRFSAAVGEDSVWLPRSAYVSDIVLGRLPVGPHDFVVAVNDNWHIAWWFNESCDVVCRWNPAYSRLRLTDSPRTRFHQREVWRTDSSHLDD